MEMLDASETRPVGRHIAAQLVNHGGIVIGCLVKGALAHVALHGLVQQLLQAPGQALARVLCAEIDSVSLNSGSALAQATLLDEDTHPVAGTRPRTPMPDFPDCTTALSSSGS